MSKISKKILIILFVISVFALLAFFVYKNNSNVADVEAASPFMCGVDTVTDIDGNVYNTVQIGNQCWMKENLKTGIRIAGSADSSNNGIIEKYCYNDSDANCNADGGLYQWNEVMGYITTEGVQGICPNGWHVPTDGEWHTLENYLTDIGQICNPTRQDAWSFDSGNGQCIAAGAKLRTGGTSNFQGISAGARSSFSGGFDGFDYRGQSGFYWSSTQSPGFGWFRHLSDSHYSTVSRSTAVKSYGFSIRCLKDSFSNVYGFAWSENIGWISFNSLNCDTDDNGFIDTDAMVLGCGGDNSFDQVFDYGVNLNADGTLSGYAWSENIGWISFNRTDTGVPPGLPYNGAETYIAKLDGSDFNGWARALNHGDGWDGWIKLRKDPVDIGPDYKVSLNLADFEGWAWGGDVVGWISFNCINEGGCATSDYKVYFLDSNTAPTALITCDPVSCEAYIYNGTNLDNYGIDLINNSTDPEDCANFPTLPCVGPPGFASCLWDIDIGSSTFAVCSDINLNLSPGTHTVDLTVTDQGGLPASAPQKTLTFKQDIFADFECSVDGGSVWEDCASISIEDGDAVDFRAVNGSLSVASSGAGLTLFSWDFGDGGTGSGDPILYTYAVGPTDSVYTVTLIITDSAGRQAKKEYSLNVGALLPIWEEVSP